MSQILNTLHQLNIKYKFIQFAISFIRRAPIYQGEKGKLFRETINFRRNTKKVFQLQHENIFICRK